MPIPASILVADGSRDCADAVAMMLTENGLRTTVAYDAGVAMVLGVREPFDAAVMDITIPGASGLEVAETLRRARGRSIKLVAYTAWPASVAHRTGADATFDEVVSKASDPLDLLRAVNVESYHALVRSMYASVEQLHLEIKRAHSLLDTAGIARSPGERQELCTLVEKRLLFVERSATRLLMRDAREAIEADLEMLRSRMAQLR